MMRFLLILLLAVPAFGADVEAGVRHLVVFPRGDAGDLDIPMSRGFGATVEVFWSERISTQFAASFMNPEAILFPPDAEPVDLGTLGLDIYSVTARYHFMPRSRLSAYAGGGAAFVVIGNLDDQFGDAFEATFDSETTFLAEAGLRYRLMPRLFVALDATYLPLTAEPDVLLNTGQLVLPREMDLGSVIMSAGLSWRF